MPTAAAAVEVIRAAGVPFEPGEDAIRPARLQAIFPAGVCDWSRRGVGQKELKDSWLAFPEPGKSVRLVKDDHSDGD